MNNKTKIGLILFSLIAISSQAYALSFGTHVKNNEMSLYRDQTGNFELTFFSRDEGPIEFTLSLEKRPKGLDINYPESFELNSGSSGDYILIENEYVEVRTINVLVAVLADAEFGEHNIMLKASPINQDQQDGSLGVNAEKMFLLKVNVLGGSPPIEQVVESGSLEEVESEKDTKTEIKEDEIITEEQEITRDDDPEISGLMLLFSDGSIFFWSVCAIIIFFVSYVIYKKSFGSKK